MQRRSAYRRVRGFTMVELMIVGMVVMMLVSFVLPGLQSGVRKSHRDEGKLALLRCAQGLEKRIAQLGSYGGAGVGAGGDSVCAADSENGYYKVSFANHADHNPAVNRDSFVLVATPQGSQVGDACGSLTLDQDSKQGVIGAAQDYSASKCW